VIDEATWARLYASPLDSLTALTLEGAAQQLSLAPLDPVASPWVARLRSLCVRVEVRSPRPVATRSMIDRVTAVSGETPPVDEREDDLNALLVRLSRCPTMALTALDLKGALRVDTVRAFTHAPWAGQLVSLRLSDEGLSSAAVRALADAPLAALRSLIIETKQPLQVADVMALARAPFFLNMRALSLPYEYMVAATQQVSALLLDQVEPDAAQRAVALLSCDPADLSTHRMSLRALLNTLDPVLLSIGRMLRPRLEQIANALAWCPAPMAGGIERALGCILAALNTDGVRALAISEQEAIVAMITRSTHAVRSFGRSQSAALSMCVAYITDAATLGAFIAHLLGDAHTRSYALHIMLRARDRLDDPRVQAIQQQALLMMVSRRAVAAQRAVVALFDRSDRMRAQREALTPWLWAALRDLRAPGPGATTLPDINWPPLIAPDGIFHALWVALDPGDAAQTLRLLQHGAARVCASTFANDAFFLDAVLSREDLLPALLTSLDVATRQRLLLRLCRRLAPEQGSLLLRRRHRDTSPTPRRPSEAPPPPRLVDMLTQALARGEGLRAHLPPLARDWSPPASRGDRAKWATLAALNLDAIVRAQGEACRPQLVSLRSHHEPLIRELAQQRLHRLDRAQRAHAASPSAPPTERDR
jgi:hypothetical protein